MFPDSGPRLAPLVVVNERDHRWEGAAIGALLGGVTLAYVGARVCEHDCTLRASGAFVGGAILGGFPGLLIGGLFPKSRTPGGTDAPAP